jgi:hypothetical protein
VEKGRLPWQMIRVNGVAHIVDIRPTVVLRAIFAPDVALLTGNAAIAGLRLLLLNHRMSVLNAVKNAFLTTLPVIHLIAEVLETSIPGFSHKGFDCRSFSWKILSGQRWPPVCSPHA